MSNYIFLLTLYPLILPNHLFKNIYGMKGFSFKVFIVTGLRLQFEDWALQITYVFYGGVALQNAFYLSGLKYYDFKTILFSVMLFMDLFNLLILDMLAKVLNGLILLLHQAFV